MESRKITIIETKNQKKSVIMSAATTLMELKADLRTHGIDYTDMAFFEGTSKTELKADSAILPHDVPYKGQTTNELVFMLTNSNKKIRSGATMSRVEAYNAIKSMGLQNACIEKFGKNFTMCKTTDLITLVQSSASATAKEEASKINSKKEEAETLAPVATTNNNNECIDSIARATITKIVDLLCENLTITGYEKEEILNILHNNSSVIENNKNDFGIDSSYSNNEIEDMFSCMNID